MVGLPGAGKTFWVDRYVPTKPEKQYNILGSNSVVNKMKVYLCCHQCNHCFFLVCKAAADAVTFQTVNARKDHETFKKSLTKVMTVQKVKSIL